ncbi:DUF72 domain-containing protein [bacterium]|nr:DUF72 domain-containing protein [bacterium]
MNHFLKNIRIGPAGWNYKDWYGIVYPENPGKGFKELDFIAKYFDMAEINSTFYHPANVYMSYAWVKKVSHNPNFKFTAKLWQRFTHDRAPYSQEEIDKVRQGMDPLAEAGLLGAVLFQFPWSYKNSEENREWLSGLIDTFCEYPLVIEIRHKSWDVSAFYDMLDKQNVGFAAIDQPVIGESIDFKPIRTGTVGYIRMHGRNYQSWFPKKGEKQTGFARYDYLYTEDEIKIISKTVKTIAEGAKETYVVQNNHPRGQAVANAAQIRADLGEAMIQLPETLIARYPQLRGISKAEEHEH